MSTLTQTPGKKPAKKSGAVQGEVVRIGRPSKMSQDLIDSICDMLADGKSLRYIALKEEMPDLRTLRRWLRDNESFRLQYARAREEQADYYADLIMEIGADTLEGRYDAQAARVASDNIKWIASKLKPKKYGDKVDLTTNGKDLPQPLLGGFITDKIDLQG